MIKCLATFILFFTAPQVFAGVFDISPSDKSVEYLGQVFGSNIGSIYLGGLPNPVLSQMFERLNFIVVTVGTFILGYITVVGTINTSQEGQVMGKKWSQVWMPLRSIVGMLLMIPSPNTGYSMIQVTVMWVILQGVGAANAVFNIVLNNIEQGISATGTLKIAAADMEKLTADGEAIAKTVLRSAVCAETMKALATTPSAFRLGEDFLGNPTVIEPSTVSEDVGGLIRPFVIHDNGGQNVGSEDDPKFTGTWYVGVKENIKEGVDYKGFCGKYKVEGSVSQKSKTDYYDGFAPSSAQLESDALSVYNAKLQALNTVYSILLPVSRKITPELKMLEASDGVKWQFNPHGSLNDTPSDANRGYIYLARDAYVASMSAALAPNKPVSATEEVVQNGRLNGWITAGAYYFMMANSTEQHVFDNAKVPPGEIDNSVPKVAGKPGKDDYEFPELGQPGSTLNSEDEVRIMAFRIYDAMAYGVKDLPATKADGVGSFSLALDPDLPDYLKSIMDSVVNFNGKIVKALSDAQGMDSGDPLVNLAKLGKYIMILVEAGWLAIGTALVISSFVAGGCAAVQPGFLTHLATAAGFIAVIFGFLFMFWTVGATMAVYLPMIPYMIWTVTFLGWMLLVVEAIVAAPILALGLVSPSQDEIGKAIGGIMIVVNIFLRPTLMIFGFVLGSRVFIVIARWLSFSMADTLNSLDASTLFSPLATMALFVTFYISLANKSFSLIYVIPDKILRWIGSQAEQTDTSSLQEAKQGFEKGAAKTAEAGSSAMTGGAERIHRKKEKMKQDNASGLNNKR